MDVNSVNKPAVQAAPAPKRTPESHPTQQRENKPHASEVRKVAEPPPKPVVNAQGHVTGRHLNVTA